MSYTKIVSLNHEEDLLKINKKTGEIKELKVNNIPKNKEVFEPKALFKKDYTNSWAYLSRELTPLEFKVTYRLCLLAEMNTNSLKPINDETTKSVLANDFGIHRNSVDKVFKRLYTYGVYGKFEVAKEDEPHTKYWILNPYLSFSGKLIISDIARLFEGTKIHKAFLDPNYK